MAYPPVPYPPVEQPVEQGEGQPQEEREARSPPVGGVAAAASSDSTASPAGPASPPHAPKRGRTVLVPFKSPRSVSSTPASPTPVPLKRVAPRVSTTFRPLTPTSTATRTTTTSLAVEITNLERKVQMLRQARKYQIADELGGDLGQSELEALGEKWREAGIAAASALWEHASSSPADLSISNSSSAPSNWSSTWGFAETSTSSPFGNQASPFESSWGWDSTPRGMGREEFTERLDEEVKLSGRTRREVLDDLDSDSELPTVDQLLESAGTARRTGASKVKRRKVELDEESEPASDDEIIEALDALGEPDPAAIEELEVDAPMDDDADDEDTDPPSQAKWTVGTLLRTVGVDPGVLGWNDDAEEFLSLSG